MSSEKNSKADSTKQLLEIRDAISEIDDTLISLLADRRKMSIEVASIKQAIDKPLRDQLREKELLESLVSKASLLNIESRYITKIFTTIIEDSVRYQQEYVQAQVSPSTKNNSTKSIAVLGGVGAYSHLAAKQFFAKSENDYEPCDSFDEIVSKVESGKTQYGVIPIENTTSGGITEVYDLLLSSRLQIIGEEKLPINHCLVTKENIDLAKIRTIVAHPQAARQCNHELSSITNAKISLCESTAHALMQVAAENNHDTAAIASEQAAELFNLNVLQKNIANQKQNFTRFIVVSKKSIPVALTVQSKTTIALSTGQQPGSLAKVLALFENAHIPLSKLESRPIPEKPWEQLFYIDLQGNLDDPCVAKTLDSLSKLCKFLKIFGSYPSENIIATQVSSDSVASASLKRAELNTVKSKLTSVKTKDRRYEFLESSPRLLRSSALQESLIDLSGALLGKDYFILSVLVANMTSDKSLESQLYELAECGLKIFWLQNFSNIEIDGENTAFNVRSMATIETLANQHQLSFSLDVNSTEQLELLVAHKGIPRLTNSKLSQTELLESAGNQNAPVILQQEYHADLSRLLNAAEYVLAKGNQQVVLSLEIDCSKTTTNSLAEIAKLKNSTHLPLILVLVNISIEPQILTSLILSLRALGVNGIILELNKTPKLDKSLGLDDKLELNDKRDEADKRLVITAKELAVIMTELKIS